MTRDEINTALAKILENNEDKAAVSETVTELKEALGKTFADLELSSGEVAALQKKNADLIQQNMKLFLKVGSEPEKIEQEETEESKKSYDDLFDEKGHLK